MQGPAACQHWAKELAGACDYRAPLPAKWTRRLDGILLHAVWGPLFFLLVIVGLFQAVFAIGQPLSNGLQSILNQLGHAFFSWLQPGC